jgi:hypothetical protein
MAWMFLVRNGVQCRVLLIRFNMRKFLTSCVDVISRESLSSVETERKGDQTCSAAVTSCCLVRHHIPQDRWRVSREHQYTKINLTHCHLRATNSTQTALRLKTGIHGEKDVSNGLSYDKATFIISLPRLPPSGFILFLNLGTATRTRAFRD